MTPDLLPSLLRNGIVVNDEGCWQWSRRLAYDGYGRVTIRVGDARRTVSVHRTVYSLLVGPVPDGLQLDHLCRNRGCCNPAHLEPVTCRENLLRGDTLNAANAGKTHCVRGHAFDEANTTWNGTKRHCRTCHRELMRRRRARAREITREGIEQAHEWGLG